MSIGGPHEVLPPHGIIARRGTAPAYIRCDNGPELTANALRNWYRFSGTGSSYIEPGAPWENPYVESFNGRLRDELQRLPARRRGRRSLRGAGALPVHGFLGHLIGGSLPLQRRCS